MAKKRTEEKSSDNKIKKVSRKPAKAKILRTLPIKKTSLKNDKKIAMDFAQKAHEKFDRIIKASVLFGSQAKKTAKSTSDIDIILIVDDAAIKWDNELIAWYREELRKLVSSQKYGRDLHINTIKLTTWWNDLIHGDPVVLNILRYGQALIDSGGFFDPIKILLIQGKIRSTPEAVYAALQRSPLHIARSKAAELSAIEGVYWSMMEAAQGALITAGKLPPSPEHIPEMIKQTFVDKGMLKINSVQAIRDIYDLHKSISHGSLTDIQGVEIDKWQDVAEQFLLQMTNIINTLLEERKE